jgi:hypothetical protein
MNGMTAPKAHVRSFQSEPGVAARVAPAEGAGPAPAGWEGIPPVTGPVRWGSPR